MFSYGPWTRTVLLRKSKLLKTLVGQFLKKIKLRGERIHKMSSRVEHSPEPMRYQTIISNLINSIFSLLIKIWEKL
jgi:hypothetical protein